jgi:hypothetical protein
MASEVRVLVGYALSGLKTERKGVTARWGPKQREVTIRSVG